MPKISKKRGRSNTATRKRLFKRRRKGALVRTRPVSRPNTYRFMREYSFPMAFGSVYPDNANGLYMNTDNRFVVIKCNTAFNKLPEFQEFKALFSEYKITSFSQTFTPYFSQNQTAVLKYNANDDVTQAVPNYEMFIVPVNYAEEQSALETKTHDEIESYLNQSQRKSVRLMPSKRQVWNTPKPRVVKYTGPLSKTHGTSVSSMGAPPWMSTDPAQLPADETSVLHYGMQLLIRRVDGAPIEDQPQTMGGRLTTHVNFMTRKVQ